MANGVGIPTTDAEWLYDTLDRLAHSIIGMHGNQTPEHQWSPLGAALAALHDKRKYATERAWCIENTVRPKP